MAVTTTSYGRGLGVGWRRADAVALTTVTWTSDGSGDDTETISDFDGRIWRVVTVPGAGGEAPTVNYDVTIVDEDSLDVLGGAGADRSDTAAEAMDLSSVAPLVHYGDLTVTIANAGAANTGTVKIYWSA